MALFDDLLGYANTIGGSTYGERLLYGRGGKPTPAPNAPAPAPEPRGGFTDWLDRNKPLLWLGIALLGGLLIVSVVRRR